MSHKIKMWQCTKCNKLFPVKTEKCDDCESTVSLRYWDKTYMVNYMNSIRTYMSVTTGINKCKDCAYMSTICSVTNDPVLPEDEYCKHYEKI